MTHQFEISTWRHSHDPSNLPVNIIAALVSILLHAGILLAFTLPVRSTRDVDEGEGATIRYASLVLLNATKNQSIVFPSQAASQSIDMPHEFAPLLGDKVPQAFIQIESEGSRFERSPPTLPVVSEAVLKWHTAVREAIRNVWVKPVNTKLSDDCKLRLVQDNSGRVLGAKLEFCDADNQVHESLLSAIYRASPLPSYPEPRGVEPIEVVFLK